MSDDSFISQYQANLIQSIYSSPSREFPSFMSQFEWSYNRSAIFEMTLDRILNISQPGMEQSPRVQKKIKAQRANTPNEENQPPNEQQLFLQEQHSKSRNLQQCSQEIIVLSKSLSRIVISGEFPQLQDQFINNERVCLPDDGHIYDEEPNEELQNKKQHIQEQEEKVIPEVPKQLSQQQYTQEISHQQIRTHINPRDGQPKNVRWGRQPTAHNRTSSKENKSIGVSNSQIGQGAKNPPPDTVSEGRQVVQEVRVMKTHISEQQKEEITGALASTDLRRSTMVAQPNQHRFIRSKQQQVEQQPVDVKKSQKEPKQKKMLSQTNRIGVENRHQTKQDNAIHSEVEQEVHISQVRQPLTDVGLKQVNRVIKIDKSKKERQQQFKLQPIVQSTEIASEEEPQMVKLQIDNKPLNNKRRQPTQPQKQPVIQSNEIASEEEIPIHANAIAEPIRRSSPIQQAVKNPIINNLLGSSSTLKNVITPGVTGSSLFGTDSTPLNTAIIMSQMQSDSKFLEKLVASHQSNRNSQVQKQISDIQYEDIFDPPKRQIQSQQVVNKRAPKQKATNARVNDRVPEQPICEEKTKDVNPAPWKPVVKPWFGTDSRASARKYQKYKEQKYQEIFRHVPGLLISKQEGELNYLMNKIVGMTDSLIFEIIVNPQMQIGPLPIKVPIQIGQKGQKLENGSIYMHQSLDDPQKFVQCNIQQILFILNASPQPVRLVCCVKTEIKDTN